MDENELDAKIARLQENKQTWAELDLDRKIEMAEGFVRRYNEIGERQVSEALEQKGIAPDTPAAAEEWLGGPLAAVRTGRLMIETLESIRETGRPPVDQADVRERPNGQLAVDVFPNSLLDRALYSGFSAEVWLQPEVERDEFGDHLATFYQQDDPDGAVNLVLGAGNVSSIAPLDALYKLYTEGRVCIIKMNPVNDYLTGYFEEVFEEFIECGYIDIVKGGAEVGEYLCEHEGVEHIHITGSDRTHDAIVFGTGEEAEERMAAGEPKIDKPVTSELGNVSPVIVAPGPWSDEDIEFHAENIATQLANNAGFNCNAVRVLVMPEQWDRREAFLEALQETFEELDTRTAYYPGAADRFERFTGLDDDTRVLGDPDDDAELPFAIIPDLDPDDEDHPAFRQEAWCTVMAETRLPGNDPGEFLRNAVDFCNDVLWGTLNASILIHPETRRDIGMILHDAIDELLYGTVVVNHWPAIGYALGVTPWGAYPGHTYQNIQSGIGVVHNTMMFEKTEKSVIDGPFRVNPKPPWFATNEAADEVAPKLVDLERDPSIGKFLGVAWSTLFA